MVQENTQGESEHVSIDVVEDLLYVGSGLLDTSRQPRSRLRVRRVESSWIRYIESFDEAARVVIVRAELNDHVPTVLKVRALASIDSLPIVLADDPSEQHRARLYEAGAVAIFTANDTFEELVQFLGQVESSRRECGLPRTSRVRLSDRELQVSYLYTRSAAPSARVIAELLGLPLASVRTYLQRARASLGGKNSVSNRAELSLALKNDGWIDAS